MAFDTGFVSRMCGLALALAMLSGCATTQPPRYALQDSEIRAWYTQAREVVQERRGVDLQHVTLSTVTSREMLFVLSDLYGKKLDPNMTTDMRVRVFADRAFAEVGFLQAVYDPFAKRIIVNQENLAHFIKRIEVRGAGAREAALTVLIHELIHAADDADYDFIAVEKRHAGDALGVYMMAEGHAELQTEEFCKDAGCSSAFALARADYSAPDPRRVSPETIHAVRASNMMLLYGQSQKFLKELKARDTDGSLVRQAMLNPPGSALDFFDAATFPDNSRTSGRDVVYRVLNAINIEENGHALLKVPVSPYDDSVLPIAQVPRMQFVSEQRQMINAAGKMVFINQHERDASGVSIHLFETTGPKAVQKKWREFESSHWAFLRELKKYGIPAKHVVLEDSDATLQLPSRATINTAQVDNKGTGETVRLYNSLFIEGNYLISVSNADDLTLNKKAMLEVIKQLRLAASS